MVKFKHMLIATAALATVAVPGAASAGKLGQAFKYYRAQKEEIRSQKQAVRDLYLNGDITKEEFVKQMIDLNGKVGEIKDIIDDLQASR